MSTVAEQLRKAREAKNLSVHEAAEATKIRTDHIAALESGDFDVFPAAVYIRGFVRTYATYLKLNTPAVLEQLNSELAKTEKHREAPALSQKTRSPVDWFMYQLSRINWRILLPVLIAVLTFLAAAYGYRAWKINQTRDPLAELGPGLYQPPKKTNGEILPLPAPQSPRR